ncbi:MAG: aminopeptidase P family protein [Clostridiaceae bacterium]|nr:aminopeptidase P family protein [Clostridiaceae bacterium]
MKAPDNSEAMVCRTRRLAALRRLMQEESLTGVLINGRVHTLWFSGFSGTESYLLITPDEQYILTDSRYLEQAGQQAPEFELIDATSGHLPATCNLITELELTRLGMESAALSYGESIFVKENCPQVEPVPLGSELSNLRRIKDNLELRNLRQAFALADEGFRRTLPFIKAGRTEKEIAATLEYNMRMLGADGSSFTTIVASGTRGALPHGVATDKRIEPGEGITIDFGALYAGYHSDLTRTVFLGEPSAEMRKIYEIVLKAQLHCQNNLRADMTGKEGDELARKVIEDAGYGRYFRHSTGHSLGLEVHESPSLSPNNPDPLPAGILITVEPGIYIPGLGGVRIEDTVILSEDGVTSLTELPKELLILPT